MRKKNFFLFSLFLLSWCCPAVAEGTIYYKGEKGGEVFGLSSNGRWICGKNFVQNCGYIWDLENNVTYKFAESTGIYGVADDGTAVGTFLMDNLTDNGVACVAGGYWKAGKVYPFLDKNGNVMPNAVGRVISADGKIVAGYNVDANGKYKPCIFKDGVFAQELPCGALNEGGNIKDISPDGQIITGWYYHRPEGIQTPPNCQSCYWDASQDYKLIPLYEQPADRGYQFAATAVSPNKRYILATIGWQNPVGQRSARRDVVWDLHTNTYTCSEPPLPREHAPGEYINVIPTDVLDDGTAVFAMTCAATNRMYDSYMCKADTTYIKTMDWMKENYAEMKSPAGVTQIAVTRFSKDMSVCAATQQTVEDGMETYYPIVWVSNQENKLCKPTLVTITQLVGTKSIEIKWNKPVFNTENLVGYRVYEDNVQIAEVSATQTYYISPLPSKSVKPYAVSALYDEDKKESEKVTVEYELVSVGYCEPPTSIGVCQINQNDVLLKWSAPISGFDVSLKHHNHISAKPFGSNTEKTFYAAVSFNKDVVNAYADTYRIVGADLFFNVAVDEMTLIIYSGENEIHRQVIDQTKLIKGRMNAIKLATPLDIPKEAEIKLAIGVKQTKSGAPLQLAEGPAEVGGDLMSEDDGKTWKTMYELSGGGYNYNWMMGLLLDSSASSKPGLSKSAQSTSIHSYIISCDGKEIETLDAATLEGNEFERKYYNVSQGHHDYEVKARWTNGGVYSDPRKAHLFVASRPASRCAAPINIKFDLNEDTKNANLTWDMPERTEITYSNWKYLNSLTFQGLTGWYQGALFSAEQMNPLVGRSITNVKFYPVGQASVNLHIYEGNQEVASIDLGSNIDLMQINNIKLNEPVEIKFGYDYFIVLELYDVVPDTRVIGMDNGQPSMSGRYISENGTEWRVETEVSGGNYMIGMDVDKIEAGVNPGVSYQVYVDDKKYGGIVEDNKYTVSDVVSGKTTVSIAAVYPDGEKKSDAVVIDPTAIDANSVVEVNVYPNPASSYIRINGEVSEVVLVNISGQEVFHDNSVNMIDVTALPAGMYMLKFTIDGKTYTNKVQVIR